MSYSREALPLSIDKSKLYLIKEQLLGNVKELEDFLKDNDYMNSESFSKRVLFSQEITANNAVEGYKDDVGIVYEVLNKKLKISDKEKEQRIRNLYNGYKYIYEKREINKENLKKLYSILSKGLLSKDDIEAMGKYYRKNIVYIYYSNFMNVEPDVGIPATEIDRYMDEYFNFANGLENFSCSTDYFIKSQILHFQFVNIHPYYDLNGRTSRTTSMWYLLNNRVYPYIIFNRGINLNKNKYYKIIRDVKRYHNITYFLNYMLDTVKIELEKEYIIDMIKSSSPSLLAVDYQTIHYILSMNGNISLKDFANFYNSHNDKKTIKDIYLTMIEPLLNKGVIIKVRDTSSNINSKDKNFIFELNKSRYEDNKEKIKRLKIN